MNNSSPFNKFRSEESRESTAMHTNICSEGINMHSRDTPKNPGCSTPQPPDHLQTFHPFPRLPTELRLEIWNLALPPPNRLYTATISILTTQCGLTSNFNTASSEQEIRVAFKIHTQNYAPNHTSSLHHVDNISSRIGSIQDLGLLRTNKEARSIYLSANTSSLSITTTPTPPKLHVEIQGKLHFDASYTTFYIPNYAAIIQRNEVLVKVAKEGGGPLEGLKMQLQGIRHLATKSECFYPSVERGAWSGKGGGPSIRIFPNLETWYCVAGDSGSDAAAEEEMRRARGRLESFRERIQNCWSVPRIEIFEL
ncbi:hypothetical protein BKA65DRAFT_594296 [Rhexocercosporidium sp. MPI-PUGE-AT-0058]|nr:hypothetical protein BKA65DRAFT_594296 [Rhexocercosporidium sp. MPI-PUGE-AT-0058]